MAENIWFIAALWITLAFGASLISIWAGIAPKPPQSLQAVSLRWYFYLRGRQAPGTPSSRRRTASEASWHDGGRRRHHRECPSHAIPSAQRQQTMTKQGWSG